MDNRIQIGSIFYSDTNIKSFVQVTEIIGKKVVVKEISSYMVSHDYSDYKVIPNKNDFVKDSKISLYDDSPKIVYTNKENNNKYLCLKKYYNSDNKFSKLHYILWNKEDLFNDMYNVWYR